MALVSLNLQPWREAQATAGPLPPGTVRREVLGTQGAGTVSSRVPGFLSAAEELIKVQSCVGNSQFTSEKAVALFPSVPAGARALSPSSSGGGDTRWFPTWALIFLFCRV